MLRCFIAPTFLSKDRGRSVKEGMQRCTQCATQAQCQCLYQETLDGFGVLLLFIKGIREIPGLKKTKRQSTQWLRVERLQCSVEWVSRDLQESLQFITLQCFLHARLHKSTTVSPRVCVFEQIHLRVFGGGMCSVSFFVCCLGGCDSSSWKVWTSYFNWLASFLCPLLSVQALNLSAWLCFIPASEQNVQVLIYSKHQISGALIVHYGLFLFIPFHQLSSDDGARMAFPQFLIPIFLWDKSLDLFFV